MGWLLDFLTKYRNWVIVLFVLPVGFIFDWLVWLQRWVIRNVLSRKTTHADRVKEVQKQVCTLFTSSFLITPDQSLGARSQSKTNVYRQIGLDQLVHTFL
jgi:hypothetical protein